MKKVRLRVLGVNAGNGINLFPFLNSKYHLIGGIESRSVYHTKGEKQWKANFGDIPFVRKLEELEIKQNPHIIIGNPKCGSSSILRYSRCKKLGDAKSEPSLDQFIEYVNELQPNVFMMENLPQLLKTISKRDFRKIFKDFWLVFHSSSVEAWGNSQKSRIRLVIIGVNKRQSRVSRNQFKELFQVNKIKTCGELLKPLEQIYGTKDFLCNIREDPTHKVSMYDYRDHKKGNLTLAQVKALWEGDFSDEYKWPIKSKKMQTLPGVYRNKEDGYPMTVRKESRQFRWDGENHTPRELAMFQGLPFSFKLYMDESERNYWLNKARLTIAQSPPFEIGSWFKICIEKDKN